MNMQICVGIKKKLGDFTLESRFEGNSRHIGILGASGCGKTLTLKSIAGIFTPDEGKIRAGDRVLFDSGAGINLPPQKRNIGYLFQNYALFPNMTVEENLAVGLRLRAGRDSRKVETRVREVVELLSLQGLEKHYPSQLSGGQQQRTALGRILAYSPELILLDEPFSALDSYLKDRLQTELYEILENYPGIIVMVSHSRDELYRFADELVVMDEGKVVSVGGTKDIFRHPDNKAAARLTGCKNFSRAVRVDAHTIFAEDWGITLRLKRDVPDWIRHVGYRAHYFEPVYGDRQENCIRFSLQSRADMPFEKNFYVKPERDTWNREDLLTWFVQRDQWAELDERGLPDYLRFREEGVLLLK